jgi:hypothetical protein
VRIGVVVVIREEEKSNVRMIGLSTKEKCMANFGSICSSSSSSSSSVVDHLGHAEEVRILMNSH